MLRRAGRKASWQGALPLLPLLLLTLTLGCGRAADPEEPCSRTCPPKKPQPILY